MLSWLKKSNTTEAVAQADIERRRAAWDNLLKLRKSKQALALETINPIHGLSIQQAQAIFDQARQGCYGHLHYIFSEMERSDPTLYVCLDRRQSALAELDWVVKRSDERRYRGADAKLAQKQKDFLESAIADCSNLPETVEHLALAFFRGFAAVRPMRSRSHTIKRFELLDSYNLCYDRERELWQFNADGGVRLPGVNSGMPTFYAGELTTVQRRTYIDYPAMAIFIRSALGERDWGRFLERYGVPPATIIMPEFADVSQEDKFLEAAQAVADAGNGALPYGSVINYATEARGTDPFSAFLEHQQKLIVLMATGGLATSLETAQGLGSGTSDAHEDSWRTIVRRDSKVIANALNRQVCEGLIRAEFGADAPILAEFGFETEPPPTSGEVFADAVAARTAGYTISKEDIERLTGYKVTPYEPQSGAIVAESALSHEEMPDSERASRLHFSRSAADGDFIAQNRRSPYSANLGVLADALKNDFSKIASKINHLIDLDGDNMQAEALALIAELPAMLPDDPEMASALEAEIAEAFATELEDKNNDQ